MIKLTITEKGGEPRALSFDQNEVSIGRVQGNDIVLPKGNISKRHSRLTLSDGRMVVADVKSTNGTYVNGRKIGEATPVRPGDKIFVGDFLIVIDPHGAPTAEVSSSGSRRAPPPPPPPPPRPGSGLRPAPGLSADSGDPNESGTGLGESSFSHRDSDDDSELGGLGGPGGLAGGFSGGRGRPPAPPPPPPRRTIVTSALHDDSADIGLGDDAPPSPDEVDADRFGDAGGGAGGEADGRGDLDDGSLAGVAPDAGNDVFGSHAADDEDAGGADGSPGAPGDSPLRGSRVGPTEQDVGGLAAKSASASASLGASRPAGLVSGPGDTHDAASNSLESLFTDPSVSSIVISGAGAMQVDRRGKLETVPAVGDGSALAETVWQLANTAVPPPPADNPVVDVRLLDGTRVTALFPPITVGSVSAVIRKVAVARAPLSEIAGSTDVETILRAALISRRNLILAGDVPSIAALFATLADLLPAERRVVSIGGAMQGRPGWIELGVGGDPAGLARAAVAFQAEHLLFADGGGAELPQLLLAAARGQEGIVACLPARSAAESLTRLRAYAVGALGVTGFAALVASTVDLIVVVGSLPGGDVRILEIAEPQVEGETLTVAMVARHPETRRGASPLEVSGVSSRLSGSIGSVSDELPGHLIRR